MHDEQISEEQLSNGSIGSDNLLSDHATGIAGNIIGTPASDAQNMIPMTTDSSCVPATEGGVVAAMTGEHLSEAQYCIEAAENGWLTSANGTEPEYVGNILELHGIETHRVDNAAFGDIVEELAQGHKVIVGVNPEKLTNSPFFEDGGNNGLHAIWITGVDATDENDIKVIVNDSADPAGAGKTYHLKDFEQAWEDSGYSYVATDKAPMNLHHHAQGFDPARDCFPELFDWIQDHINHPEKLTDELAALGGIAAWKGKQGVNNDNKMLKSDQPQAESQFKANQANHFSPSSDMVSTTKSNSMKFDHNKLFEVLQQVEQLDEIKHQPGILAPYKHDIECWQGGLYELVVLGEVKRGKSSFVNALLGEEGLSPVADHITSAVPVKFIYGDQLRYVVHFLPDQDGDTPEPKEIQKNELALYATEQGIEIDKSAESKLNRNNHLMVNYIQVEYPNRFLKEGLILIDLPGLGGVFQHHTRLVWEYLEPSRVDHVAFVFDSVSHPINEYERDSVVRICARGIKRFMFLQTKTDQGGLDKTEIFKNTNLNILSGALDLPSEEIKYFLISNTNKQAYLKDGGESRLRRSGFVPLEKYLTEDLMQAKKDHLAEPVYYGLLTELNAIKQHISTQANIYRENSAKSRAEIVEAYRVLEQKLVNWERNEFQPIKREFELALRSARVTALNRIEREITTSNFVNEVYAKLDDRCHTEQEVIDSLGWIEETCTNHIMTVYRGISNDYQDNASVAHIKALEQLKETMPAPYIGQHAPDLSDINVMQIKPSGKFGENIRNAFTGATSAAMVAAIVTVIIAPIAAIAALIGGLFVWLGLKDDSRQRHKNEALNKMRVGIVEVMHKSGVRIKAAMMAAADEYEITAINQIDNIKKVNNERFKENLNSAKEQLTKTDTDIAKHRSELEGKMVDIDAIIKSLHASVLSV